jgi:hypothetical protein
MRTTSGRDHSSFLKDSDVNENPVKEIAPNQNADQNGDENGPFSTVRRHHDLGSIKHVSVGPIGRELDLQAAAPSLRASATAA